MIRILLPTIITIATFIVEAPPAYAVLGVRAVEKVLEARKVGKTASKVVSGETEPQTKNEIFPETDQQ